MFLPLGVISSVANLYTNTIPVNLYSNSWCRNMEMPMIPRKWKNSTKHDNVSTMQLQTLSTHKNMKLYKKASIHLWEGPQLVFCLINQDSRAQHQCNLGLLGTMKVHLMTFLPCMFCHSWDIYLCMSNRRLMLQMTSMGNVNTAYRAFSQVVTYPSHYYTNSHRSVEYG